MTVALYNLGSPATDNHYHHHHYVADSSDTFSQSSRMFLEFLKITI